MQESKEPLFMKENLRTTLFPIQDPFLFRHMKKQHEVVWFVEEIPISEDLPDWEKLKPEEQWFIKHVLGFFSISDVIVNANLESLILELSSLELKMVYQTQCFFENIHTETYALLLETLIKDDVEREIVKNATLNFPAVAKKKDWCYKYITQGSLTERIVAFAIVERLFFAGSFASIFYMRKRGLMIHGLGFSNELISRDEFYHIETGLYVYAKLILNKLPEEQIFSMVEEALSIEREFIIESLPVKLIGMNSDSMIQYMEYCADSLLFGLVEKTKYNVANPFDWMDLLHLPSKSNFFEKKVAEYSKGLSNNQHLDKVIRFDAKY